MKIDLRCLASVSTHNLKSKQKWECVFELQIGKEAHCVLAGWKTA